MPRDRTTARTYARRLLVHYNAASPETKKAGRSWYPSAYAECERIAAATGYNVVNVAHAMAALSPLRQWGVNVRQTWDVARALKAGRRLPGVHFQRCTEQAKRCMLGDTDALSGPKVRAFALAILGDSSQAVIDSHMLNAMGWKRPYSPKPGGMYNKLATALAGAARAVGEDTATFQAIVWTHVRGRND